jgi:hypothetical protein
MAELRRQHTASSDVSGTERELQRGSDEALHSTAGVYHPGGAAARALDHRDRVLQIANQSLRWPAAEG